MAAPSGITVTLKNSAFRNRVRTYIFKNIEHIDIKPFFAECKNLFITQTQQVLEELANLKINATLEAQFKRTVAQESSEDDSNIEIFHVLFTKCNERIIADHKNW